MVPSSRLERNENSTFTGIGTVPGLSLRRRHVLIALLRASFAREDAAICACSLRLKPTWNLALNRKPDRSPRRAVRAELRVRPAGLSRRAGGDRPARHGRRQLPGADADRRRQVAVLSVAVTAARRLRHRGVAADRADARPGRGPARGRRQCGGAELDAVVRGSLGGRAAAARRRSRPALCRAGTAADAALPRPCSATPRSRCLRSTRRIACRNGGTISAPNISACPCSPNAFPTCRASR